MAQAQIKAVASTESKAAPAPVAGAPAEAPKAAPAPKTDRKVVGGPAFDRLVSHGASIIVLPSKGKLHSLLSGIGATVLPVADMPAKIAPLSKDWAQFDRGYLVGPSASYSACAVNTGSKKAKAQPAFVYATPGKGLEKVTLYTSDGNVWDRPTKGERERAVYDAALKAATAAFEA